MSKKDRKYDSHDKKDTLKDRKQSKNKKVECEIVLKKSKPDFRNKWNPDTDSEFSSL